MKVALIFPNNIFTSPYLKYYTRILDQENISYDLIIWDRANRKEENCIAFESPESNKSRLSKILDFLRFRKFVISNLKKTEYTKVIVFTGQLGLFLSDYLVKNYKNNYILDIRDYSKTMGYFEGRLKNLIANANFATISSNGFKEWLPKSNKYVLGHNIGIDLINKRLGEEPSKRALFQKKRIHIDTIGQIKDFGSDSRFIDQLKNDPRFYMNFIGFGISLDRLKEYVSRTNVSNLLFHGAYEKDEEEVLLENTDLINILITLVNFNKGPSLLSNRLYLSALLNIPCIVNANTEQSKILDKYNFGFAVGSYEELPQKIMDYKACFDEKNLRLNCEKFMKEVKSDYMIFEKKIKTFIEVKNTF